MVKVKKPTRRQLAASRLKHLAQSVDSTLRLIDDEFKAREIVKAREVFDETILVDTEHMTDVERHMMTTFALNIETARDVLQLQRTQLQMAMKERLAERHAEDAIRDIRRLIRMMLAEWIDEYRTSREDNHMALVFLYSLSNGDCTRRFKIELYDNDRCSGWGAWDESASHPPFVVEGELLGCVGDKTELPPYQVGFRTEHVLLNTILPTLIQGSTFAKLERIDMELFGVSNTIWTNIAQPKSSSSDEGQP